MYTFMYVAEVHKISDRFSRRSGKTEFPATGGRPFKRIVRGELPLSLLDDFSLPRDDVVVENAVNRHVVMIPTVGNSI